MFVIKITFRYLASHNSGNHASKGDGRLCSFNFFFLVNVRRLYFWSLSYDSSVYIALLSGSKFLIPTIRSFAGFSPEMSRLISSEYPWAWDLVLFKKTRSLSTAKSHIRDHRTPLRGYPLRMATFRVSSNKCGLVSVCVFYTVLPDS